ncbi:hypothetical protein ACFQRC_13235 [Enterovirga sp. GCM10030262]|uniref:hypothetical protein n=1 Tax=Enterovirga sp. GCM10030262 TaxID=3273391 RepID=UPI003622A369
MFARYVWGGPCAGYLVMDNDGSQLIGADVTANFNIDLTPKASGELPWALLLRGANVKVRGRIKEGDVNVAHTTDVDVEIESGSPDSDVAGESFACPNPPHVIIDKPPSQAVAAE